MKTQFLKGRPQCRPATPHRSAEDRRRTPSRSKVASTRRSLRLTQKLFILSAAVLSSHTTQAQLTLDRDKAIALALENNLELQAAASTIAIAEVRLENAGLKSEPKVALQYSSDQFFNNEGEYGLNLSFSKKFPLAKRLEKAKDLTALSIEQAKLELAQRRFETVSSISRTSLEIQILDTKLAHLQKILTATNELQRFTQSRVESGELSPFLANQLAIEIASIQQEIDHLDHEREDLTYQLATATGLSADSDIEFAPTPQIQLASSHPEYDPSILERHSSYQLIRLSQQSADAAYALALSQNWDDLEARFFWENERSVDAPNGLGTDRFLGIALSIPIPLQKKGYRLGREKLLEKAHQAKLAEALELQIQNDVHNARRETIHSQELLERFEQNLLPPAQKNYADINDAYQKGHVSLTEVLQAHQRNIRLEEQHIEILEEYARAHLALQIARIDL
ncbi:MAG: TolC family protein [Verrucomicrobiota bacterium]